MSSPLRYRLALDLGSNSIGWVLFEIDSNDWPIKIIKTGVRIFSNSRSAKTSVPLSVERRDARSARRRRDRNLQKKKALLKLLKQQNLLCLDKNEIKLSNDINPYLLRHEALSRKLTSSELSRVLIHLSQRRGFLSNRKNLAKDEGGKSLGSKITKLKEEIEITKSKTLGSFLFTERVCKGLPTRMRGELDWYPNRSLYISEFDMIVAEQSKHWSDIHWDKIKSILFFQRSLKKQQPGMCLFKPELERSYRALPSFQRFRLLQLLANLKIMQVGSPAVPLTTEQKDILISKLSYSEKLTYDKARELLELENVSFNLEVGSNSFKAAKYLHGDKSSAMLSGKKYFGKQWKNLSEKEQNLIVEEILNEEDEIKLKEFLTRFELSDEQVQNIISLSEEDFERGYSEFSKDVVESISQVMTENLTFTYDQAVKHLGFHHSDFRPKQLLSRLPYYGEVLKNSVRPDLKSKLEEERIFGKIANPTVHVALNQLRKIVNALTEKYGQFDQVVVEVARDLPLGKKGIDELAKEVRKNESQNEKWGSILAEHNLPNNYGNRLRLRLWEELNESILSRRCPYSGENISIQKLFSDEVEIDHILPKSRTFTNHHSNLILCLRNANKAKGDRSPFEAFANSSSEYIWSDILDRVSHLPLSKQSKFNPDAMDNFKEESEFLERQLNDTRFISKATGAYLQHICKKVMVSRGRLTAFLRSEINLNRLLSDDGKKNRNDHRHHAIDAFLVGLSTPKTLVSVFKQLRHKDVKNAPLSNLVEEFKMHLYKMIISHRIDHSVSKKLFEETSYGKKSDKTEHLVIRKAISDINDYEKIVDDNIRKFIAEKNNFNKQEIAIEVYNKFGAKKLKTIKIDASAIQIKHPKNEPKYSKWMIPLDVCKLEFWRMPNSKQSNRLEVVSYTSYEASKHIREVKKPHPAARKILTIRKGDYLCLADSKDKNRIVVVESLKPANETIIFTDHNISKNEDAKGRSISFGTLASKKLRVVSVNTLGDLRDPGAWWINDTENNGGAKSG